VTSRRPITQHEYERLAAFRYALAQFLAFSQAASAAAGLTPRQYQALLALKGHGGAQALTIGELAERLQVHHHSAVGLVDRLAALGLASRVTGQGDRRRVHVVATAKGERRLARLAAAHRDELGQVAQRLQGVLDVLAVAPQRRPRPPRARAGHRER